ncbi:MAG: single-stranded DNA-binding protein [Candidatus Zixiibacteriota bacterium]
MVNKVTLIGRVGQDPEIRNLPSGTMVANFSLATNRRRKDQAGNWIDETEWHRITTFGKTAETMRNYVHKGMLIYVDGRIHYNRFEDKDGIKRSYTDIIANRVQFLEKRDSNQQQNYSQNRPQQNQQQNQQQPEQNNKNDFVDDYSGTEDDVPF